MISPLRDHSSCRVSEPIVCSGASATKLFYGAIEGHQVQSGRRVIVGATHPWPLDRLPPFRWDHHRSWRIANRHASGQKIQASFPRSRTTCCHLHRLASIETLQCVPIDARLCVMEVRRHRHPSGDSISTTARQCRRFICSAAVDCGDFSEDCQIVSIRLLSLLRGRWPA